MPASDGRHRSGHVNICLYIYIYIISRCIFEKTYREIYRYIDIYIICLHLTDAIAQLPLQQRHHCLEHHARMSGTSHMHLRSITHAS